MIGKPTDIVKDASQVVDYILQSNPAFRTLKETFIDPMFEPRKPVPGEKLVTCRKCRIQLPYHLAIDGEILFPTWQSRIGFHYRLVHRDGESDD